MEAWLAAAVMIGVAVVIGTTVVLRGPMGKALAEWIRGWSKTDQQWLAVEAAKHGAVPGADQSVLAEVDELKRRLSEVEERLDFAERLLARERDPERLAPPRA
jgi:hypothetical protein